MAEQQLRQVYTSTRANANVAVSLRLDTRTFSQSLRMPLQNDETDFFFSLSISLSISLHLLLHAWQERRRRILFTLAVLPILAIMASMLRRIQHQHTPYLAASNSGGLRKPEYPAPRQASCDKDEGKRRVISLSLYGNLDIYDVGAVRNAKLIKKYFPGWVLRVYANMTELRQGVAMELRECAPRVFFFFWCCDAFLLEY
jgi:hypothetical protein